LVAARASGAFTNAHQRFWDAARRAVGDGPGTRALIGVLLLHRTLPSEAVTAGMDAAVAADRFEADLVAVEARRCADAARPVAAVATPAGVAGEPRPLPTLAGYDQLLSGASA
jgi:hypothetical protein